MADYSQMGIEELARLRSDLASELSACTDFVPGSLHEMWRKCGKPNCRCAREGDRGHGPRRVLVRREDGKVRTVSVPDALAGQVADKVAAFESFTAISRKLVEVNTEISRRELVVPAPGRAGEGGGSRRQKGGPKTGK